MPAAPSSLAVSVPASPGRGQREFEHECAQLFGEFAQTVGVPRSVGQIYGILFGSPQPLCFSDIVEQLGVSKGSASQGLRLLRSLGAINVVERQRLATAKGSLVAGNTTLHRDYYEPELSLRKLVSGVMRERVAPLTATGRKRLDRLRELAEKGGEERAFYLERAKQLNTWQRRLNTVLPVLSTLLGPKSWK